MPSINTLYFAAQKVSDAPTLTIFKERGLENKIPTTVDNLEIYGKPRAAFNMSLSLYKDSFGTALAAYQAQEGIVGISGGLYTKLAAKLDPNFLAAPKIIAVHEHKDRAEAEKFFGDMGFVKIQNKTYATFIGTVTSEFLSNVTKYSINLETRTDRGLTNLLGFAAYTHASKLLKTFLSIHNAVIKDGLPIGLVTAQPASMDTGEMWGKRMNAKFIGSVNGDDFPLGTEDAEWIGLSASMNLEGTSAIGVMRPVLDSGVAQYYGPTSACPFTSGVVIPYFHDLIIPSPKSAVLTISRYFFGTFGDSEASCAAAMTKFRKGFAFLSGTETGMMLTHAYKCVELAMECNAGIYIVVEKGVYHGSVLGGSGFMVVNKGMIVKPTEGTVFQGSLLDITGHDHALTKLCKLLSVLPLKGETELEVVKAKDIKTSMDLMDQINRRSWKKLAGDDEEEGENMATEIYELCDMVTFDQNYLVPSIENILKAAEIILSDGKISWPKGTPVYLRGGIWEDIYVRTLASFGHIAPSLMAPKGEMMLFAKSDKEDEDPSLKDHPSIKGIKAMRYAAVHIKALAAAAKDWKEMIDAGAVRYQTGVKGGPTKCSFSYIGENRAKLWYGLSKLVQQYVGDKPKVGKKRKAEEDPETRVKKLKEAQEFLDDLF
nr:MAG: hypothetical protein [Heterobasidion ambi-like virus 3]